MKQMIGALLFGFVLALPCLAADSDARTDLASLPDSERLRYTVSYQGVLTLGLPVDIAEATLQLRAGSESIEGRAGRRVQLSVTTEPFPRMEAFYPLRFDYQSWLDPRLNYVALVSMHKVAGRQKRDLVWFDHREGTIRTYRTVAGEKSGRHAAPPARLFKVADIDGAEPLEERWIRALPGEPVLDRMGMLYLLRSRPLEPGQELQIPVSNGKDLIGYRVRVEARESIDRAGEAIAALRVMLQPRFDKGGSRGYRVHLWLSDDDLRLPLRFRSAKFGGAIELRLQAES